LSANEQYFPVEAVHDDVPHMQLFTVFGALASIIKHDGIGPNAHFFAAWLQNMLEAAHAAPLQMQGLGLTVEPSVEVHALAAKQMHLKLLLQASVEVG